MKNVNKKHTGNIKYNKLGNVRNKKYIANNTPTNQWTFLQDNRDMKRAWKQAIINTIDRKQTNVLK